MTEMSFLERTARRTALASAAFVATGDGDLASHVMTFYLLEAEAAGYPPLVAMSALVGQLLSVVAANLPPHQLHAMSLELAQ